MWIAKATIPSLDPASCEAKIVLDHKTTLAPRGAKSRLSCEAKTKAPCAYSEAIKATLASTILLGSAKPATREANTKAPLRANSITVSTSLSLTTPSAKNLCREARDKAPLRVNSEVILASFEGKALHDKFKFASKGRTKTVASPGEPTLSGEAILASPIIRKKALKAKPKASQPKRANIHLLESL